MWHLVLVFALVAASNADHALGNNQEPKDMYGIHPTESFNYTLDSREPETFDIANEANSEYDKEFYSFSAPEEEFSDTYFKVETADMDQQNSIIIMAPEDDSLEESILDLEQQSTDSSIEINEETNMEELEPEEDAGNETCTAVKSCGTH